VLGLESEYLVATSAAQLAWVRSVIMDLRTGRLAWSEQELLAMALGDAGRELCSLVRVLISKAQEIVPVVR
jgi:hypothetical protein